MVTVDVNVRGIGENSLIYLITTPDEIIPGTIDTGIGSLAVFLALKLSDPRFTHIRLSSQVMVYTAHNQQPKRLEGYQISYKSLKDLADIIREFEPSKVITSH